jgi:hypothetical protein
MLPLACLISVGGWRLAVATNGSHPSRFASPRQVADFALQHGLCIHSGAGHSPVIRLSCFVADHPLDMTQLNRLRMTECGLTPAWKGIIFVGYLNHGGQPSFALHPNGLDGHYRIWGDVLAAGDPELLDRLEVQFDQP